MVRELVRGKAAGKTAGKGRVSVDQVTEYHTIISRMVRILPEDIDDIESQLVTPY